MPLLAQLLLAALGGAAVAVACLAVARRRRPTDERRFRALMGQARVVVWEADPATARFTYVGDSCEQFLGFTRDQWLAPDFWAGRLHPDDRDRAINVCLAATAALEDHRFEYRLIHADGRAVWVDDVVKVVARGGKAVALCGAFIDITDRKRVEAELRESEAVVRLHSRVLANMAEGVRLTDAAGVVLYANPAEEVMFGYAADELAGRPAGDLDADPPAARAAEVTAALTAGGVWQGEWHNRRRDGSTFYTWRSVSVLDVGGRPCRVLVEEDVTDRKRAAAVARNREELLRAIIAHIPCGVFWKDRESVYLGCNDRVARDWGLASGGAVFGRTDLDLCPDPAEAEFFRACDRRVMETGEPLVNVEEPQTRPDGTLATLLTSKVPLRDGAGTVVGVVGVYQDITDRKRVEAELRDREARARAVLEASPDLMFLLSADGTFLEAYAPDPALLAPRDVLVGRRVADILPPAVADAVLAAHATALAGGRPGEFEYALPLPAGDRHFEARVVRCGADGTLSVVRDVTDKKGLERQLRQAQKMEAVGRLAGGIAHDFNNILTAVNGFGELALEAMPAADPAREWVREMADAGRRAADLTRRLMTFSRQQVFAPRSLDLDAAVADVAKLLSRVIGEGVVLDLRPAGDLWPVDADPGQLEQVLMNLAVNARDAMPDGGTLTVSTRNAPDALGDRDGVELVVSDTGVGMSPEVRARVFEPFYTTKPVGEGTGLGLAIVYGVVQEHHGRVDIESEPGAGTTFRIVLPRGATGRLTVDEPASAAGPARGSGTVLLAEDEDSVRALTTYALRDAGYDVLACRSGTEALERQRDHAGRIDLLVTDVVMPGLGGRELAEAVAEARPGMAVLFLSGHTEDAVLRHGVRTGEAAFLGKPFTPAALVGKVRSVLRPTLADTPAPALAESGFVGAAD